MYLEKIKIQKEQTFIHLKNVMYTLLHSILFFLKTNYFDTRTKHFNKNISGTKEIGAIFGQPGSQYKRSEIYRGQERGR